MKCSTVEFNFYINSASHLLKKLFVFNQNLGTNGELELVPTNSVFHTLRGPKVWKWQDSKWC